MLPLEHSPILLTFIKLPFVFKTFILSNFELLLKTGLTVDHLIPIEHYHFPCNFCRPLITLENSLDPDQDRQNVSPDLDLNWLTL